MNRAEPGACDQDKVAGYLPVQEVAIVCLKPVVGALPEVCRRIGLDGQAAVEKRPSAWFAMPAKLRQQFGTSERMGIRDERLLKVGNAMVTWEV